MKPEHVLVLTAMVTISSKDIERLGFHALSRPTVIEHVVRAAADAIRAHQPKPG
jgi:hypothetical protein